MAPAIDLADPRGVGNRLPLGDETSTLPPVPRAHALLIESIHPSADEAFARADIAVHRRATGLAEDELIEALLALPGDGPVLLGIRSKTSVRARVFESVPRLNAVDSLHPGNGGNSPFSDLDLDNRLRMVFYPAVAGWVLLGLWMYDLRNRSMRIAQRIQG